MNPFDATKQDLCVGELNEGQGLHGSRFNCTWCIAAICYANKQGDSLLHV